MYWARIYPQQMQCSSHGLHWASFLSWPWHKACTMKAPEMLDEDLMKMCNPWWRSIIPCEELKLSPERWERSSIFLNLLFIMLKKLGQGLYVHKYPHQHFVLLEVGAKVFQSSHHFCFAYSWDFCSKNKLSII